MAKRKRRKAAVRKKFARRKMTRKVRQSGMSVAVSGLRSYRVELVAQRAGLDAQIRAVENALAVMGTPATTGRAPVRQVRRRGRRPRVRQVLRPGSLKAHIVDVLSGGGIMAVKDITAGVLKTGYKTKNRTLAKSVGIALTELKGVDKVGRGRFRMK